MKIGLYNLEPKIENTAMMKVSWWHKKGGDHVEIYNHLMRKSYDKIYAFSLFDFTDKSMVTPEMICGGTGFDIESELPFEIAKWPNLDYSIFPNCKTSYIWFSRGCIRACPFCVVHKKEGKIRKSFEIWTHPKGEYFTIMDNNFFASPSWRTAIDWLVLVDKKVDLCCGIDVRIFTDEQGEALQKLKFQKQLHTAWDNPKDDLMPMLKHLAQYIKPYKIMVYVLIGYWSTPSQDLARVRAINDIGMDPYVMPFNKHDEYQKNFARWVNHKAIFNSVTIEDYKNGKIMKYFTV